MKYEVQIQYVGVATYFVEANSASNAEEKARVRYTNGEKAEWGQIMQDVIATELP